VYDGRVVRRLVAWLALAALALTLGSCHRRELGGTLGVAIIGSVFSSLYVGALDGAGGVFAQLPPEAQAATKESVAAAGVIARDLGPNAPAFIQQVNDAFLSGLGAACFVSAGVALAGAVFASRVLPARA